MKQFLNFRMALLGLMMLSISNLLAQEQRIPFQGTLYQSGTAVNGAVNITFTIDDPAWTETHENVSVTQGVYAVVLGETTAFPEGLFAAGTAPQLTVVVGGTEVANVPLHAPFINAQIVGDNMPGELNRTFDEDGAEFNGLTMVVDGAGDAQTAAFEGVAQSTSQNTGVEGFAVSGSENTATQNGLYGQAAGEGEGNHRGVMGYGAGAGKYNHGLKGYAAGAGNGDEGQGYGEGSINFGVEGNATGNAYNNTGVEGSNFGTEGVWNFGVHGISNAGTGTEVENTGVAGRAYGSGKNVGVYGTAGNGAENWAGIFDGDVNINGQLMVNGEPLNGGTSSLLEVKNPDGDVRAELSYFDQNDAGSVVLYGANDSTKAILGTSGGGYAGGLWLYDSLRNVGARLNVTNKGQSYLYTYNEQQKATGWFGNYGNNGFMQILDYDDTGDVLHGGILAGFWAGHPELYMELDNGMHLLDMGINPDSTAYLWMRGRDTQNIAMGAKSWETEGKNLPYLQMVGNDDGQNLVWMEVQRWEDGTELGALNFQGTDGSEFNISSHGIGGMASINFGNNGYDHVNIGAKDWEGNNGDRRGFVHIAGTDDGLSSGDTQRGYFEVNDYGSGSFGVLGLKNYADDGGGYGQTTVFLNGENGDASFNGNVYAGSFESNGDNDSRMGISAGGINMGQNAYTDGIVMNYDNVGGSVLEMYSSSTAQVILNGSAGTGFFTGAVTHSSDARFKKNVKSIEGALAKTQKLNGYTYNWNKLAEKQKGIKSKEEQVGVLAQELEVVFPQLVKTDDEGYKAVNYAALTAVLIEAVKELSEQVSALQGENAELKAELTKVDELEIKIDLIQKLLAKQTMEASQATVSR